MKCTEIRENLDAYADGEIDFSKRGEVEPHLKTCSNCHAELEGLQTISRSIKQTLPIATPAVLDTKVMSAFQNHHTEKKSQEKVGWFGIPKLAFATAFVLLALFSGSAFQFGRMSVGNAQNPTPVITKNNQNPAVEDKQIAVTKKDLSNENESQNVVTKVIEVPVVREKIVEVPVIKEKIVTRVVYKEREPTDRNRTKVLSKTQNDENLTQAEINKYQIVSELRPKIIKAGENNEN